MRIITHRGLDPSRPDYFPESSREAFEDQLSRGFGLEFDLQFTAEGGIIVLHDSDLARITEGKDTRAISDIPLEELLALRFQGCHLITFPDLLRLIEEKQTSSAISAIHLKDSSQQPDHLDSILDCLKASDLKKLFIFDVKLATARYLKEKNPNLQLAPSVAHPYDIERYNRSVGGTLISAQEIIENRELFDWVWLDEWDLSDSNQGHKVFYSSETFACFREAGLKIALVSPELHATSPGLLGGESHPDARDMTTLAKRIKEIIVLKPDAICTDYPDLVSNILAE